MENRIYTIAEMKKANKAAGGYYFHKSNEDNDKKEGVKTRKEGNVVIKIRPDGSEYAYRSTQKQAA